MRIPAEFDREVCAVVAQIPAGRVTTYGLIARLVGFPNLARRVGRTLAAAAEQGLPCHRVVDAAGRTAPGWPGQRVLLEAEGVVFRANGRADLRRCGWEIAAALRQPCPEPPSGNKPSGEIVSSEKETS